MSSSLCFSKKAIYGTMGEGGVAIAILNRQVLQVDSIYSSRQDLYKLSCGMKANRVNELILFILNGFYRITRVSLG